MMYSAYDSLLNVLLVFFVLVVLAFVGLAWVVQRGLKR